MLLRELRALIRASWLSRTSYRLRTLLSLGGIIISVIPLFFIADALQPVMEEPIRGEGERYFGFVIVGTLAMYFVNSGARSMPSAIQSGIHLGTLEAMLGTPVRLPSLLAGLIGAGVLWTALRMTVLLVCGWALGAGIHATGLLPSVIILVLILLAHVPFGLIGVALVLVFRTTGPLPTAIASLSMLLGGVYYPTHVIPSWIQYVSDVVPLTYGARALRRVLLEGSPMSAVVGDLAMLLGITAALYAIAMLMFSSAFRYARRAGTLAQY